MFNVIATEPAYFNDLSQSGMTCRISFHSLNFKVYSQSCPVWNPFMECMPAGPIFIVNKSQSLFEVHSTVKALKYSLDSVLI